MQQVVNDTERFRRVAEILRSIAHPMRFSILSLLNDKGRPMTVTEIYKSLDIEQSVASHHLSILRNAGVVQRMHSGKFVYYSASGEFLSHLMECVNRSQEIWSSQS
jgi:transcriptional regulator, arsR family